MQDMNYITHQKNAFLKCGCNPRQYLWRPYVLFTWFVVWSSQVLQVQAITTLIIPFNGCYYLELCIAIMCCIFKLNLHKLRHPMIIFSGSTWTNVHSITNLLPVELNIYSMFQHWIDVQLCRGQVCDVKLSNILNWHIGTAFSFFFFDTTCVPTLNGGIGGFHTSKYMVRLKKRNLACSKHLTKPLKESAWGIFCIWMYPHSSNK